MRHLAISVLVHKLRGRSGVNPLATLLVRRRHPEDHRESRPRVASSALISGSRHNLQRRHRLRPLPQRRPQAIRPGVAAANHDDVLALSRHPTLSDAVEDVLGGPRQVIHRLVDPAQIPPGNRQVTGHCRTRGEDEGVKTFLQILSRHVHTNRRVGVEAGPLRPHLLDTPIQHSLLHLELRDPVAHQATDRIGTLEHRDRMPCPS